MWTVTRQSHPHNTEPHDKLTSHRVQTWLELPDGSIALSREVNHDESVIVDFDPPMVIFPARIARSDASTDAPPGFTQQTFVTVHPMNKPEKVRVKGPATQRIWYDGFESPPASSTMLHPAARLRATCEIDFGVSRSTNHTITHLHPTLGVLHELRRELAVAFTVTVRDTTEEWSATTPDFTIK